jgi:starch synthase
MRKPRVLFVSQEITPFLEETPMGYVARYLPQKTQEKGKEIRTFMPRYGVINERRHQLHEVIRLSGMNMMIGERDYPLIIKVASIQAARMQVYFIDNEEFFQRKQLLVDGKGKNFSDNDERSIFFNRGVIETIKKLGWSPDIIHCHGWFTGLMPLYIKRAFQEDPLFADTKIVYSLYDDEFSEAFPKDFSTKIPVEGITKADVKHVATEPNYTNLMKIAIDNSDAIIYGAEKINADIEKYVKKSGKTLLEYKPFDETRDAFLELYDQILEENNVLVD